MTDKVPKRRYRSAGGVVVRPSGDKVLVLRRSRRLDQTGRAEVRLPKGHIESGENPEEAALREVREETGLDAPEILSDLGHQSVEFVWKGRHYVRDEHYFLMTIPPKAQSNAPERQFRPRWLPWQEAMASLTFQAEREWLRRAQVAWQKHRTRT